MSQPTDSALRSHVRDALDECPELDPDAIDVSVAAGVVLLDGRSRSAAQRAAVTSVVLRVVGVGEVRNRLVVAPALLS